MTISHRLQEKNKKQLSINFKFLEGFYYLCPGRQDFLFVVKKETPI